MLQRFAVCLSKGRREGKKARDECHVLFKAGCWSQNMSWQCSPSLGSEPRHWAGSPFEFGCRSLLGDEVGTSARQFCFSNSRIAPYLVLFGSGWATAPSHSLSRSLWVSPKLKGCGKKGGEIGGALDNISSLPVWLLGFKTLLFLNLYRKKGKCYALIFTIGYS